MNASESPTTEAWPDGLLLSYYGDDFTGSTDVMEAFTAAGVPTVLFLRPPTPAWLKRFPDVRLTDPEPAWRENMSMRAHPRLIVDLAPA